MGSFTQSCCEKRPLWGLLPWSWLVFPPDQVCVHLEDGSPSLIPSSPSASFSTAGSSCSEGTANLLPLPPLVLESRAGPIHPCCGTGSVLKASLRCTSQSPEEWSGATVQQEGLSCRCPKTSPGRAQTRSGSHQSQTLYSFPLQGLQKLLLLLVVWHGACWHTQPSSPFVASDRGNLTKLLPTPDRSIIRQHWAADVVSYEDLLRN